MLGISVDVRRYSNENLRHLEFLLPGHHEFNFQFYIPNEKLPSSVESHRLSVRYSLAACIEKLNDRNYYTNKTLTLNNEIDVSETGLIVSPLFNNACFRSTCKLVPNLQHFWVDNDPIY